MKIVLFLVFKFTASLGALLQESDLTAIGPILEPNPVIFTFETIGWAILAVMLFLILVVLLFKQYRKYFKNKYRRDALQKLHSLVSNKEQNFVQINKILVLLKQVAIITFGREKVAVIYGDEWYSFLESTCENTKFTNYSTVFSNAVYESENATSNDFETIVQLTKNWIKKHA